MPTDDEEDELVWREPGGQDTVPMPGAQGESVGAMEEDISDNRESTATPPNPPAPRESSGEEVQKSEDGGGVDHKSPTTTAERCPTERTVKRMEHVPKTFIHHKQTTVGLSRFVAGCAIAVRTMMHVPPSS